jgi:DNA-binding XRE family transcriptional regulator
MFRYGTFVLDGIAQVCYCCCIDRVRNTYSLCRCITTRSPGYIERLPRYRWGTRPCCYQSRHTAMSDTSTSTPDAAIGRVLRELRLNRNIKQLELARALGVTRATVTRWELGSRAMTVSTLLAIADLLDAPASLLLPEHHQAPVSDTHDRGPTGSRRQRSDSSGL